MQRSYLSWLIAFPWIADAFSITSYAAPTLSIEETGVKVVIPTSTGQIGVNPVPSDLGDPITYVGEIYGTDTQYITVDDSTSTKVHLPYLAT
jgi:hypothetical protein